MCVRTVSCKNAAYTIGQILFLVYMSLTTTYYCTHSDHSVPRYTARSLFCSFGLQTYTHTHNARLPWGIRTRAGGGGLVGGWWGLLEKLLTPRAPSSCPKGFGIFMGFLSTFRDRCRWVRKTPRPLKKRTEREGE